MNGFLTASSGVKLIKKVTLNSDNSDIEAFFNGYDIVEFMVIGNVDTDDDDLIMRLSNDGSTFESGTGKYRHVLNGRASSATTNYVTNDNSDDKIRLTRNSAAYGIGNASGEALYVDGKILHCKSAFYSKVTAQSMNDHISGQFWNNFISAEMTVTNEIKGIQVSLVNGNFKSGTRLCVYGVKS